MPSGGAGTGLRTGIASPCVERNQALESNLYMASPAEVIQPDAGNLVESLRDFGYTLPSALADLIDNSLTAGAKEISLTVHAGGEQSHIAVIDDGCGMDLPTLLKAMQLQDTAMPKRPASLAPFSDRAKLPVLPASSRFLVRPNF